MSGEDAIEFSWLDLHEAENIAPDWRALAVQTETDVWFSQAWIGAWGRHFGKGRQVMLLSARRGPALVAMLPFVLDTIRPGGVRVRLAQLAGPHPLFGVLSLPIEDAVLEEVIGKAIGDLLTHHGCDCVSLAPVSETFGLPERVRQGIGRVAGIVLHPDTCPRLHTVIRLPDSFETYLASLSRNRRNKYRKTKRVLEEDHGVATHILSGPDAAHRLDTFIEMHNRQWQQKGRLGHFADWPQSAAFYADFCRVCSDDASARLYLQQNDAGEIVSALFCFVAGKSCHALVPARGENQAFPGLNIGLHAQFERIEHITGEGIRVLDSGAGEYDYKASLKGETLAMHRFLVGRDTLFGKMRMHLLRRYANLLNLLYYRIWFNRTAPKLRKAGLKTGPLWQSWIRSRV